MTPEEIAQRLEKLERDNRRLKGFAVGVLVLASLVLIAATTSAQTKPDLKTSPPVDADALCAFITQKMQTALPQVPTFCTPITDSPLAVLHTLSVSVFCPTDVLEGKMRRAWSTGLFQTFQGLFLGGALNGRCKYAEGSLSGMCEVQVSDSSMSEVYYSVNSEYILAVAEMFQILPGDLASDDTYFASWETLLDGETRRHPDRWPKGNAESIADEACREFADKIREYDTVLPKLNLPVPGCTVMLATHKSVYVVLDFPNFVYAAADNYTWELPDTFGKRFDGTDYDGQVIFRSPWTESGHRTYRTFDLRGLELSWQEGNAAGSAKDSGAAEVKLAVRLEMSNGLMSHGVEDRNSPKIGNSFRITVSAAVRVTPVPGADRVLVDLTDGSEWSIAEGDAARCGLTAGSDDFLVHSTDTQAGDHKIPQYQLSERSSRSPRGACPATFVQGW